MNRRHLMSLSNFILTYGDEFDHPIACVNINLPDQPLIYVNKAFQDLTQYPKEQILGKNCRFLQGKETDPVATSLIRHGIQKRIPICQDLINYKKGGEKFFNRLVLCPFEDFNVEYYLGLQHQISSSQASVRYNISPEVLKKEFQEPVIGLLRNATMAYQLRTNLSMDELKSEFDDVLNNIEHFIMNLCNS